jgi:hypothetical protein
MTAAAEAALALASKVCAWEFAPPGKTAQRDVLLRYAENVDVASLEALLATGCVPPARAGTAPQPCALLGCLADVVHPDRGETLLHRVRAHVKALSWTVLPTTVQLVVAKSSINAGILGAAMAGKHDAEVEGGEEGGAVGHIIRLHGTTLLAVTTTVSLISLAALAAILLRRR